MVESPQFSSPEAWERLIESAEPAALLLVIERRMGTQLGGFTTAEDVLQEALLHAWRDRSGFDWRGARSFRAWLLGIVDHRLHDAVERMTALKRGGGRPPVSLSCPSSDGGTTAMEPGFPRGSTTPSRVAMYREQAEAMRAALEGLPDEVREIVRLRLLERCPLGEIAARLNLGASAVRHRFRKGADLYLRRLRVAQGSASGGPGAESVNRPPAESSPDTGGVRRDSLDPD